MIPLTPRQTEIAHLLATGLSYKAVAIKLGLSVSTVKGHITSASDRLPGKAPPRHKLVLFALLSLEPKRQAS